MKCEGDDEMMNGIITPGNQAHFKNLATVVTACRCVRQRTLNTASVHCTLYPANFTIYTVHCIQYTVQCTLYSAQGRIQRGRQVRRRPSQET